MEPRGLTLAADRAMRSCLLLRSRLLSHQSRSLTTTSSSTSTSSLSDPRPTPSLKARDTPRWKAASPPPRSLSITELGQGRMPFKLRAQTQPLFRVIKDDEEGNRALDEMYTRFLGRTGETLLPKELKWLAVTHKSFDHGWQGSNDRLALLGKRVVDLQVTLALLDMPRIGRWADGEEGGGEEFGVRKRTGALDGLANLTRDAKERVQEKRRVAALARQVGIDKVMRWKPKKTSNLEGSGVETVAVHTLYAIIGAIDLHRGGETMLRVVRERVLGPLGLRR